MESHEQDLREEVLDEEKVLALQEDYTKVALEPPTKALLDFAAKLTREPTKMTQGDIETLREHNFEDRDILDAVQLIGYFNYTNRVMDSLGIRPEPDMRYGAKG